MTAIDEIKSRIDLVDLVSETVQLRRSGKNYTGFCPFHPNSRTPAFVVFSDSGTWRCFGQCNEGGDIFKYVMKKEGWDFTETLHYLADKAGVQLKPPTPEEQAAEEEHQNLRALLEEAVTFYHHQLMNTPVGRPALEYLRKKRNLSDSTIEAFGLGYSPNAWEAGLAYFTGKGHSETELLDAGLVTRRQLDEKHQSDQTNVHTGVYDRFRNRIMFPIRDERGRMAGFGARILNPDDVPKFLNSPQTVIFDKGGLLYGLDKARKAIRSQDQAVIVEGYLDVIALHQAGYANVISPMGTALTEAQLNLLKRFSKRIVLALDPDAAGNQATLRGLQVARQTMDRENEPTFDARGLLSHEARLQADIRVTTLPEGKDPDEVVAADPKAWQEIVSQARPVVIHVMETLATGRDLDDPKVKTEIANQVLPLIQDVPNPIERDTFRQRLARLLRVDERALLESAPTRARPARRSGGKSQPVTAQAPSEPAQTTRDQSTYALEAHCLGVLLRHPDLLYLVDRALQVDGLGRLAVTDFQHADHQDIYRLLQESIDQDIAEPLNYVLNSLSLPMMDLADGLLERTGQIDPSEDRVLGDVLRGILNLRKRTFQQQMEHLQFEMTEAQEHGSLDPQRFRHAMQQLTLLRQRLDRAMARHTGQTVGNR